MEAKFVIFDEEDEKEKQKDANETHYEVLYLGSTIGDDASVEYVGSKFNTEPNSDLASVSMDCPSVEFVGSTRFNESEPMRIGAVSDRGERRSSVCNSNESRSSWRFLDQPTFNQCQFYFS